MQKVEVFNWLWLVGQFKTMAGASGARGCSQQGHLECSFLDDTVPPSEFEAPIFFVKDDAAYKQISSCPAINIQLNFLDDRRAGNLPKFPARTFH